MKKALLVLVSTLLATAVVLTTNVGSVEASDPLISIGTIAEPPAESGVDAATLREATEEAIRGVDVKDIRRPISVSLALISMSNAPASCVINVTVQDKRKGNILGIAAGSAIAPANSRGDQRPSVARIAAGNAVNRVPDVVTASK